MPLNTTRVTNWLAERFHPGVVLPLGIALGWIVLELLLRRGAVPRLAAPLGGAFAADWTILAVGFPAMAALLSWVALRAGQRRADWGYEFSVRALAAGVAGAGAALAVTVAGAQIDRLLFGAGETNAEALGVFTDAIASTPELAVLFLLGNGLLAPIAEEQVWRAVVQTDLVDAWGVAVGVGATALLFALKHVVVDWSLARVTTLLAGGVVLGLLRHRYGTVSSALAHIGLNAVSTTAVIVAALG